MRVFVWLVVLAMLSGVAAGQVQCCVDGCCGPDGSCIYEPNWASLDQRPTPKWWVDAKFGIFVDWGLCSVPAWSVRGEYAEWYWNRVERDKSKDGPWWRFHKETYGEDFEYKDFAPMFKGELFDPDEWAELFERSGAKYVVLISKHHDGYCLWPSEEANKTWGRAWNSVDVGPGRDVVGELTEAVRKTDLRMGIYYSLYEWFNPLWLSDRDRYVAEHMIPQFKDLVTRYEPMVIFSDGEWDMDSSRWRSEELLDWLFNDSPVGSYVVINDRWGKDCRHKHGGYYTTEYGAGLKGGSHPWEENRGMAYSYGYSRTETLSDYKSGRELVLMLVDMVSRGGNLLLDIGPAADGRIPVIMEERLIQIGTWLEVNGEAIYSSWPWRKTIQWTEGKMPEVGYDKQYKAKYDIKELTGKPAWGKAVIDAFFTCKGDTLYAITPRWPKESFVVREVSTSVNTAVTLLGHDKPLQWEASDGDVVIDVPRLSPDELPCEYAYVFEITEVE